MSHYFINDKSIKSNIKTYSTTIKDKTYKFKTDSGVFSKDSLDYGSRLLIETVDVLKDDLKILDLGCGYGPIGISLANENKKSSVYMYDINEKAVNLATENAKLNSVSNVFIKNLNILEGNDVLFDLIVTNPPIRAGKDVVFKFYEDAFLNLKEKGRLYVVIQKKQGAPSTFKKLEELFNNVKVIKKQKGYWIILAKKHKTID